MIDILVKGMGVGLAVAAPVGPIGLLCIRRTLTHGKTAGLASGLGAASADAVYGFMVAAGLAATGLLITYARPMTIIGGLLIVWLGAMSVRVFLRSANNHAQPAMAGQAHGVLSAYATTFALTISNPMTILAFLALVAGLGASTASHPAAPYVLVLGVFVGSALWWLLLVHVAAAARTRLTPNATRWLDLVSGLILTLWGAWIVWGALS